MDHYLRTMTVMRDAKTAQKVTIMSISYFRKVHEVALAFVSSFISTNGQLTKKFLVKLN